MRRGGTRPSSGALRAGVALAIAAALALLGGATSSQAQVPAAPVLKQVGDFTLPEDVAYAPGAPSAGLLFIVEDRGTIQVIDHGTVVGHPFLDIQGRVDDAETQGLMSVAFPADYRTSRLFYVYYTNNAGNDEIDEFQVSRGDPTDALENTRRRVIVFPHPTYQNHHGGELQFGPDGMLWLATGDGGGPGDPGENAQDLTSPLGKLIRIDPRASGTDPYTVPADNPYVGAPGRDEIWGYGFRNPWRFSFDGDGLLIADVGQKSWEEVSYETIAGARGANFGWDNYEGTHLYEGPALTDTEFPIFEYSSGPETDNCAVIGGNVFHDPRLPDLAGRYLYADHCVGELRTFIPALDGATDDAPLGPTVDRPTSFGVDAHGRLYVATIPGPVYRIDPAP